MEIQNRLQMVMRMNNMNASQFADKIGVQRSSISHILTGRNKPSLDFIQKTLEHFPRVNADWLITGKVKEQEESAGTKDSVTVVKDEDPPSYGPKQIEDKLSSKQKGFEVVEIEKIIWFYSDGSYRIFEAKKPC